MNYYNEYDRNAAAWIRGLIAEGLIPAGDVDDRSITDVQPGDLAGYAQCHFFAGIAGWSLALHLAGWPADKQVWTGSCPCQPYSQAGKRKGAADSRDLWPEFLRLISACRPGIVFGEQVASADVIGKAGARPGTESPPVWLDRVFADLEAARYTCGAADIPAAGVNAPHIRQRLFWVGYADGQRCDRQPVCLQPGESQQACIEAARDGGDCGLAFSGLERPRRADSGPGENTEPHAGRASDQPGGSGETRGLGDSNHPGPQGRGIGPHGEPDAEGREVPGGPAGLSGVSGGVADTGEHAGQPGFPRPDFRVLQRCDGSDSFWSDFTIIPCGDGKARRIGTGIQPLVDGLSYRVGARGSIRAPLLKGAGNAIVFQSGDADFSVC